MYLVDTNIFLEWLLGRENAIECEAFLEKIREGAIEVIATGFTIHSICIYLTKNKKHAEATKFLDFVMQLDHLEIINASIEDNLTAIEISEKKSLDFDDALQYHVADSMKCSAIVTFDTDFKKTGIQVLTPRQILENKSL